MIDKKKACVLATVTAALFLALVPNAHAQTVEQGANYDKILVQQNPDGTAVYTNKVYPYDRILDGNTYKDYIFTDAPDHLRVETMGLSVKLDKTTCEFSIFDEGIIGGKTPLLVDDIIPYQSVSGSGIWNRVTSVDDAACQVSWDGAELKAKKSSAVGYMEYVFMHKHGSWKTELRVKNESGLNNRQFGFRQIFELSRDTISFGGAQRNLDNFDGQVFGRTWLENNEAKVIELMTGQKYDLDLAFPKLSRVWVNDTGVNSSQLTFEYFHNQTILPSGSLLVLDPTYSGTPDTSTRVTSATQTGTACSTTFVTKQNGSNIAPNLGDSDLNQNCGMAVLEFDISSIDDGAVITNSSFQHTISTITGPARNCDLAETSTQPSQTAGQAMLNDAFSAPEIIDNNSWCTTTGGKDLDLGSAGDTYVGDQLASDWIGFYVRYNSMTRDTDAHNLDGGWSTSTLTITYVTSCDAPTSLAATTASNTRINLAWVAPASCGLQSYGIYQESPTGGGFARVVNSTGNTTASYAMTGLDPNTEYNFMVFGWNANGEGANSTAAANMTYPSTPSLSLSAVNSTAINATSTVGSPPGGSVEWFGLRCEINRTGGWNDLVTNSSLPAGRIHTINGVWTDGDLIICQWRDGNDLFWSDWSANATYPARPDRVTDLTVVAVFQTTAEIEWTEPELHGLNLTGYQVNFTSPWGNPLTEITTTNTSDTEYAVTGLAANTQYSMRVSAVTIAGNNATGNIINFATATNFTVGQIDIDAENPLRMPIRFVRDDINDTTTALTVTYDNDYDLTCDMFFKFSQTNQTFPNINGTAASSSEDEHTFYFLNPETEIISVDCYDTITNDTGSYLMMQSDFPLLDLIAGFRDGTYGTQGMFGAIDLITLMAIILGMIGFNRTNPAVGLIFMFFIIGGLSVFGIVQWYTAVTGLVATLLLFAVSSTRKED